MSTQAQGQVNENLKGKLQAFLNIWHEHGREEFERQCPSLTYDTYYPKTYLVKRKWIYLVKGSGIVFMLDPQTERVYLCKGWGVPNFQKFVGTLDQLMDSFRESTVTPYQYA